MPLGHPESSAQVTPRPGAWWYALGLLLMLGGATAFLIALNVEGRRLDARLDALARVTLPAGGVVELHEAGEHAVFYEGSPHAGTERIAYARIEPSLVVTPVNAQAAGGPIEVRQVEHVEAYPRGPLNGLSIARFDAPAPGSYRIDGRILPTGEAHPDAVLAVGRLDLRQTLGRWDGVFGGAVAATVGLIVGSIILVLTLLLRRRDYTTRDD